MTEHQLMPPERVPLRFTVSSVGDRFVAFLLDMIVLTLLGVLVISPFKISGISIAEGYGGALAQLILFLLRSFYFVFFELIWLGRTPGKRMLKIRVLARDGGPLTAEMLFARNLLREVEFFLPLVVLSAPEALMPGGPIPLVRALCVIWALALLIFPVFSSLRLRLGDLLAGTMVVSAPEATLLEDLAAREEGERGGDLGLSTAQLDVYGIHELQVLEDVLRKDFPTPELHDTVAQPICKKLGVDFDSFGLTSEDFLRKVYRALRKRLEEKLLMGTRQERKRR